MNVLRCFRFDARVSNVVINGCCNKNSKELRFPVIKRTLIGQTYEGTGKTTAHVLNKKYDGVLLVNGITERGFRLNNNWNVIGPTIFFPHALISWNVKNVNDVTEESLSLFTVLYPKIELLILGFGGREDMRGHVQIRELMKILSLLKVNFEIMTTENAVATFNFCSSDRRSVAAALIPPSKVIIHHGLNVVTGTKAVTNVP